MNSKEKFWQLLDHYPRLSEFWDRDGPGFVYLDRIKLTPFSSGEVILANVLVSIWQGNGSKNKIDITDLAALPEPDRKPILEWLEDPFWP